MKRDVNTTLRLLAVAVVVLLSAANIPAAVGLRTHSSRATTAPDDSLSLDTVADSLSLDTLDTVPDHADLPWPQNVQARITQLLGNRIFETSTVGLQVYDLTADSVIFSHNAKQLMRPASTLKMMVAVAALDRLGSDYSYRTVMATTAEQDSNVLRGDLYFRGAFDPMIDNGDLDTFIDSLRSLGIDTLRGNIYSDLTFKDSDLLGEGWCWDDDNPVLSPLLAGRKDEFAELFLFRLMKTGIVFEGNLRKAKMPGQARTLCAIERPLTSVMRRMLKQSDNLYSESVFYHLASKAGGVATARSGRGMMNRLIQRLGFKPSRYYIADGSGLSLYNYVSPELEVAFLHYAYSHDDIYRELIDLLPVAGEDGTLSKRMRHSHAHRNVKAKTGTVTGVSALAGYCTAKNGHRLCFSIINMGIRYASSGRNFQDRVCNALCK